MTEPRSLVAARPEVGSIWQGAGATMRVYDIWEEDARVYLLTGKGRLLKAPHARSFVPIKHFSDGTLRPFDFDAEGPWERAIADRYGYNPPREADDPRICKRCVRAWGSKLVQREVDHYSIFNWLTNRYHASISDGQTHCGLDATGGEWLWPI